MSANKKSTVRNPLRTRVFRELRIEWRKYAVIFIFLTLMIGFISGMYVANNSMLAAADSVKVNKIREDGHFILKNKADEDLIEKIEEGDKVNIVKAAYYHEAYGDITTEDIREAYRYGDYKENLEKLYRDADKRAEENYENAVGDLNLGDVYFKPVPVKLFENFRKDTDEDIDGDGEADAGVRVYINRDDINLYSLMSGEDATSADEIVIDRMHADNNGIKTGDTIRIGGEEFKVTGLVAFSNYSTLHKENTDMMFDAITFDVAMTTQEGWDRINAEPGYEYAWLYEDKPVNTIEEKRKADDFLKALVTQVAFAGIDTDVDDFEDVDIEIDEGDENEIEDYVPEYANQAINFTIDDFGSDMAMGGVILDILIIVLAFIFAVTESNSIAKEAPVIGTLRASGYTKKELTRNYLAAPVIVTLFGALTGNILGYSLFKKVIVAMYYNSYSLPPYITVWTPEAFVKTTVIPVILMLLINWLIIKRKMRFSPLRFLRSDLKTVRRKRALKLPDISFIRRFRIRIFLQNIPGYLTLFVGIFFVMVMLAMAVGMPDTLSYYQEHAQEMMLADYQVILTSDHDEDGNEIITSNPDAEKFSMEEKVYVGKSAEEDISVYGMEPGSRYVPDLPAGLGENDVCVSSTLAAKYRIDAGDEITLKDKYGYDSYQMTVKGIIDYDGAVALFMDVAGFNKRFDRDQGDFNGYFSDSEITDINDDYVASVVTSEEIYKMAAQLDHSMGAFMLYFQYLCIILSAVLIYLLTKVIVERNEKSISMVKILGYTNKEVAALYLITTTIVVLVSELITVFISRSIMNELWNVIMMRMSGFFPFVLRPAGMVRMCALIFVGYLLVLVLDFRRIRRIPMDEALKDME